jgi:hypothetical protein
VQLLTGAWFFPILLEVGAKQASAPTKTVDWGSFFLAFANPHEMTIPDISAITPPNWFPHGPQTSTLAAIFSAATRPSSANSIPDDIVLA